MTGATLKAFVLDIGEGYRVGTDYAISEETDVVLGRTHPELAEYIAVELGCDVSPTKIYDFANGEIFVRFEESVRGSDAFLSSSRTPSR